MTVTTPTRPLTRREQQFVVHFCVVWNATQAARLAGYKDGPGLRVTASRLLARANVQAAISARLTELAMSKEEVLVRLAQQARNEGTQYLRVHRTLTDRFALAFGDMVKAGTVIPSGNPLIQSHITYRLADDARERVPESAIEQRLIVQALEDQGELAIEGILRRLDHTAAVEDRVGFDVAACLQEGREHLIKSLKYDSNGNLNVELYDAQAALSQLSKYHGLTEGAATDEPAGPAPVVFGADLIAPSFVNLYRDIRDQRHTEYLLYGGRGSTKSSFVSLVLVWLLTRHPEMHALVMRQVKDTLRDSVYSQLQWAIAEHGLEDRFKCTVSPLEMTYLPTGQKIYFRGGDEPGKIKSIKPPFGYIGMLWFEELDQFRGPAAVRNIEQSALRGGDVAYIFKSFNPPRSAQNWANKYVTVPKASQLQHFSNYRDVPPEWLGETFLREAEHLKSVDETAYRHEYGGEVTGTGGTVFPNVELRAISDDEIAAFDSTVQGLDWGYALDPLHWIKGHYHAGRRTLYLFDEFRAHGLDNRALAEALTTEKGVGPHDLIIADSAEPKSIADLVQYGLRVRGAEKGPDSVRYSIGWLQKLVRIVIDPVRCPHAAQEFIEYEYEQTKDGEWISAYPDRNNHAIDAARYATNLIWRRRGQ